jgi:hypothetical protein
VICSVIKNLAEREVLQVARSLGSILEEGGSLRACGPAVLTGLDAWSRTTAESFHVRSERDSQPHAEGSKLEPARRGEAVRRTGKVAVRLMSGPEVGAPCARYHRVRSVPDLAFVRKADGPGMGVGGVLRLARNTGHVFVRDGWVRGTRSR